jgi:hypothetical protein
VTSISFYAAKRAWASGASTCLFHEEVPGGDDMRTEDILNL